jgi:protoheme ferro-lyase
MYISKNARKASLFSLIKIAAKKSEDLDALRKIFVSKYPGERAAQGFAVQYYNKFIRNSDPSVNLTEENLPQPIPDTIEELKSMLQSVETVKAKTKKEELAENLKSKYPNIDFTNLNEDYLSWLHQRYIENKTNPGEIVHPIEEAMETLKKFPSIQAKYKASPELKNKVEGAGYEDISYIGNLTLDDMEKIITLDTSDLTVRVEGIEIKDEEFLGKFGEWNLWLPHTKETSAKIAGYDEKYNPKTTWCTARTKGSNLFYNYIGRQDIPTFLFYIIKDNPKNDEDWLSLGYVSQGYRLAPDFSGRDGGLSVNRANNGLKEGDFSRILGDAWNSIKSRIEDELENHKIIEDGEKRYISPARSIIESLAKNVEEFKKELGPKSNEEKKDFIEVIMDSEPSEEVSKVCVKTLLKISTYYFLKYFSKKPWAQPYIDLAAKNYIEEDPKGFIYYFLDEPWAKDYIGLAAENVAKNEPKYFLSRFSEKPWAKPYIDAAARNVVEEDSMDFLHSFLDKPWAKDYIDLAANNSAEKNSLRFISYFLDKPWAQRHIDLAVKNIMEKNPYNFLDYYSEKPWAKPYIDAAARNVAEETPSRFLDHYSENPWAKPYIDAAARNVAEENPKYFLSRFSYEPWAKPYIDAVARNVVEENPMDFISYFLDEPWAKDYIGLAAENAAKNKPGYFLSRFSDKPWAQPYIPLAESKLKNKEASSKIKNKLIKLSNFLKSNNLEEYKEVNYLNQK